MLYFNSTNGWFLYKFTFFSFTFIQFVENVTLVTSDPAR